MDPSTIGLIAFAIFAFGFGPLWPLVLTLFPLSTLGGLLAGQITMSDKRLEVDDDKYNASLLSNSEMRVRESLSVKAHTEDH